MKKLLLLPLLIYLFSCDNKRPTETQNTSTNETNSVATLGEKVNNYLFSCDNREFPEVKDISTTKHTNFVATLEEKVDLGETQIYCSTLLYAWQEIKTHFDNNISINDSLKALTLLNSSEKHLNSLSENEIETSIKVEERKITTKAFFTKSLAFEYQFEKDNYPLTFMDSSVHSFGVNTYGDEEVTDQIDVLFYNNDNDFGIKLITDDKDNEVLLYLPSSTKNQSLGNLTTSFLDKIEKHRIIEKTPKNYWKYNFLDIDKISIPALKLNLEKNDSSLIGNHLYANNIEHAISKAYQRIALILDEKGAEIESEAEVVIEAATEAPQEDEVEIKPKKLIFDKPFLLVFKRIDTDNPYLVLWIANNELMTTYTN